MLILNRDTLDWYKAASVVRNSKDYLLLMFLKTSLLKPALRQGILHGERIDFLASNQASTQTRAVSYMINSIGAGSSRILNECVLGPRSSVRKKETYDGVIS